MTGGFQGWRETNRVGDYLAHDPILRQTAPDHALVCRCGDGRVLLAFPWDPSRPFPLVPAFCLAQVKEVGGRRYVVVPVNPPEAEAPPCTEQGFGVK
jgi:hypothetical protein